MNTVKKLHKMEEPLMSERFIVETSARHLHVTEEDLETLFGKGAKLHYKKELSQPGQYACEERVDVVGPKKTLNMSIIGPCRPLHPGGDRADRRAHARRHPARPRVGRRGEQRPLQAGGPVRRGGAPSRA